MLNPDLFKGSGPIKALVAVGLGCRTGIIIAHDSLWLDADIEGVSGGCEDLGIETPAEAGIYLWEGSAKTVCYSPPGEYEPESEYTGACRVVRFDELPDLLRMTPPDRCVGCGGEATHTYPDDEGGRSVCSKDECKRIVYEWTHEDRLAD